MLDKVFENEIKKFNINDLDIKSKNIKYVSKDDYMKVIIDFIEKNEKIINKIINKNEHKFTLIFQNKKDADDFANNGTIKLPSLMRQYLKSQNKDPLEYDIHFNFIVNHDDSLNSKKPNLVEMQLL